MMKELSVVLLLCGLAVGLAGCARLVNLGPEPDSAANGDAGGDAGPGDAGPGDANTGDSDSVESPAPTACRAASAFGDNFDDGTLGDAWYDLSQDGATVDEQSGELFARPASNGPGSKGSRGAILTRAAFDLTAGPVVVEVISALAPSSLGWTQLQLITPLGDRLRLYTQDGALGASYMVREESFTEVSSVPYQPAQHRWWRIRAQDGVIHWETAADGASWKSLATATAGFAVTWVRIQLEAGTGDGAGDLGGAHFDNLNPQALRSDGSYEPCPLRTVSDDFEDGRQSGLWAPTPVDPGGTREERNGNVVLAPPAGAAGASAYTTFNPYDVRGGEATIHVAEVLDPASDARAELRLTDGTGQGAAIVTQAGALRCVAGAEGSEQQLGQASFDLARHRWWRLREAAGVISCETSADGAVFETLGNGPAALDTSAAFVQLRAIADAPVTAAGAFAVADFNPSS